MLILDRDETACLLGRDPTEAVWWPAEPMPSTWSPVWAIVMRKGRGRAIYCGQPDVDLQPLHIRASESQASSLWREMLWYRRRRIAGPTDLKRRVLWKRYQESARNA
jgi:hypothetical protein